MSSGLLEPTHFADIISEPDTARLQLGRPTILTSESVESIAAQTTPEIAFSAAARIAMAQSAECLQIAHLRGDPIYGLTTGFGPFVQFDADQSAVAQGSGLISHLAAGYGKPAAPNVVRAAMILRAHTLAQGCSGVDPAAANALLSLIRAGIVPAVPEIGSVGASGDLIPLSHIARVITGEGEALDPTRDGDTIPAADALASASLSPLALTGRDALAIVNGTSFMAAYAALAVAAAQRLIEHAESLSGWISRQLGARAQALDPRLHLARGHDNQSLSARRIAAEANAFGPYEDTSRPLQEVYSIRCAPQFLGACRDNLDHARRLVEREINGVSDNPVVCSAANPDDIAILHGGNFQGQQIAFAADALNAALVQTAILAERQLDVLCNPEFTGATLLLASNPGATSGFAGAQITATSIIAEMRLHGGPVATSSIPTNGRNQDVVSMGTTAARTALEQTERCAAVLAITAMATAQLNDLRARGRCPGRTTPTPRWMAEFKPLTSDRSLRSDITRIAAHIIKH